MLLIIFPSLKTLNTFKSPKRESHQSYSTQPNIASNGIVETVSIKNLPFKYFVAIVFQSITSSPFLEINVVLKVKMISRKKQKSIIELNVSQYQYSFTGGLKEISNGIEKQFHVAKAITKISHLSLQAPIAVNIHLGLAAC